MTSEEIVAFTTGMPGVVAVTASAANGAPEVAWGDTFLFFDPDDDPAARRMPFATVVVKDYPGFDTASDLDRAGVFRVNIAVRRERFEALIGHAPAAHAAHADEFDYAAADRLLPHPVYAPQAWVSVVSPGAATDEPVRELLAHACERAGRR